VEVKDHRSQPIYAQIRDVVASFPGSTTEEIAEEVHAQITTVRAYLQQDRKLGRMRSEPVGTSGPLGGRSWLRWFPAEVVHAG
jgi:hypothetical protein